MFLKILKIQWFYDPPISLLGIYPEKPKTLIQKDLCIPMFTAALFTLAEIWKQSMCSLRHVDVVHIYNEILLGHKKE